ncbi:MAG: hypothetical protein AAF787_00265 [Chloroflexota bacterium]
MRLVRFANELVNYTIPGQVSATPYFGGTRQQSVVTAGMIGAFDTYGDAPFPDTDETVTTSWWLEADTPTELRTLVDEVYRLKSAGLGRLFIDPQNGNALRWTRAKVARVDASENVAARPHKRLRVTVEWYIATPRWYSRADATYAADGSETITTPRVNDVGPLTSGDTLTITNNGNAEAQGVFTFTPKDEGAVFFGDGYRFGDPGLYFGSLGGGNVTRPGLLRRNAAGTILQRVFSTTSNLPTPYTVNSEDLTVTTYSAFNTLTGTWLTIPPGATTFEAFTLNSSVYWLTVEFWDTWVSG